MTRRVFVAAMATETNTFSPICIDRRAFEASLYAPPGQHPETPTLCTAVFTVGREMAARHGWTLIEGTAAWADPAGLVARETHEGLRDEILGQLAAALPLDAVVIGLHGAMVAAGCEDCEGDLLARIRALIGPDVPLLATLDPHSHLTPKRVAAADVLIAFKEFPHTDFVERARDAWALAARMMAGEIRPRMAAFDCRMIDVFPTSQPPMRGFVDRIIALERDDPQVLSISVIHGFMAGDVPEMGTRLLVVTDDAPAHGEALAERLGRELFALRGQTRMAALDPDTAVARAMAAPEGPVVIADIWDNPGGGTAGDATVLTQALIEAGARAVIGTIWDPVAVGICMAAGEGAEIALRFGAKSAPGTGAPIDARVRVSRLQPAAEMRFGASRVPFGDAALVTLLDGEGPSGIRVILNATRAQGFDPSLFTALGIEPAAEPVLVIKSTNHFQAAFAPIASEILYCAAGNPYPSDPGRTAYRRLARDLWPRCADPHPAPRAEANAET